VESKFRSPQCKRQLQTKQFHWPRVALILDFAGRSDTSSRVKKLGRFLLIATIASNLAWRVTAGPAPVLSVSGNNTVLFQWPTNLPSFALETRTNFAAATTWKPWAMQPSIVGTNYIITNNSSASSRFFRLSNWPQQSCANQLKQVGLAFRVWGIDNNDRFPFQVPTNQGGTMELRAIGPDGFDTNAFLHFQVISNELSTPLILVCPGDVTRTAVTNFADLKPENVTYRLRTSDDVTDANPDAVLAVCPIDGNTLYCSGAVTNGVNY
jgi:hypothetical protein